MPKKKDTAIIHLDISKESLQRVHAAIGAIHKKLIALRKEYSKLEVSLNRTAKLAKGRLNA